MKEQTKKLIDNIIGWAFLIILFAAILSLSIMLCNQTVRYQNEKAELLNRVYAERAQAETYEAYSEIAFDLYQEKQEELKKLKQENKELYDAYMQAIYRYQYTDDYQELLAIIDEKLSESDYDTLADDMDRYDMIIDQFGSLKNFYRYNQGMISLYDDYCGQLTNGTYAISDFFDYIEQTEPEFYEWLNDMYNLE